MNENEIKEYKSMKPLLEGIVALVYKTTHNDNYTVDTAFEDASKFMNAFERRNGIK